jgi:hypothetical protein
VAGKRRKIKKKVTTGSGPAKFTRCFATILSKPRKEKINN